MDKLDLIIQKLESLESGQKELNSIIHAVRDRQDETDAKLEALAMDVNYIRGDISEMKENQERHERVIESLSIRSLEQETILRELKRK